MNTKISLARISALLLTLIITFGIFPSQTRAMGQTAENADNAHWEEIKELIEENLMTEPETTGDDENEPTSLPVLEMLSEDEQEEILEPEDTDSPVVQVSSYTELSEAIKNASTDGTLYIIEVTDDIDFASALTIATGKNIIIMTDKNNPATYELTRKNVSNTGRHFTVNGTLTLINIVLDGDREHKTNASGGIYVSASGVFNLNDSAVIENCSNTTAAEGGGITVLGEATINGGIIRNCTKNMTNGGGGVHLPSGSAGSFTMNYGAICNNIANASNAYGCGIVSFSSGTITINGGEIYGNVCSGSFGSGITASTNTVLNINGGDIYENTASNNGGGVYVASNATLNMTNGTISNNTASTNGGGIYINTSAAVNISGATISGNTATGSHGGGIYIASASSISISGSTISNNTAASGNGGGIYTARVTYDNLTTAADTLFTGNRATKAYAPPPYADTIYTNIGFYKTSITNHPLNNYDINYTSGSVITSVNLMVSFDSKGGSSVEDQTVLYGNTVSAPEESVRDGYDFTGWYTDAECTNPFDFTKSIIDNITLYAGWMEKEYTVTFNNSEDVTTKMVIYGDTVDKPEEPVRDSYDFTGWYTDAECTNPFDFTEPIIDNIMLYAGWTEKEYTVTFNNNEDVTTKMVIYGDTVDEPEDPVRDGYDFTGWYTDAEYTKLFDFTEPITDDIALYAGWMEKEYSVIFNNNEKITIKMVIYGDTVDEPEEPVRAGYDFTGWYTDAECTKSFDFTESITGDITLYAGWIEKTDDDEFIAIDDTDDTNGTDGGVSDNGGVSGSNGSGNSNVSNDSGSGTDAILSDGSDVTGYLNPSTGQWEIYDSDGVPLGAIDVQEDQTLQEALFSGEMTSLGGFYVPSKEYAPTTEDQKINPKTGDHQSKALLYLIIAVAALIATVTIYLKVRSNSNFS